MDAEKAHYRTLKLFRFVSKLPILNAIYGRIYNVSAPALACTKMGLKFDNPIGLAAGFDKDAAYIDLMAKLGFGFIEIGTVTPKPQIGNPKPRLFRLLQDEALINRMGFSNKGVAVALRNLEARKSNVIVGGNIGKNKVTPNEDAVQDYKICFEALHDSVDYFVVNVSSPNTPGLRALQEKKPLMRILSTLQDYNKGQSTEKPLLLKIAPDLEMEALDDILKVVQETQLSGLVATNTTISRANLMTSVKQLDSIGAGGLSGKPLLENANSFVSYLREHLPKDKTVIGVGGIHSPPAAKLKLDNGADLIQVYSGLVFQGPGFVNAIKKQLLQGI